MRRSLGGDPMRRSLYDNAPPYGVSVTPRKKLSSKSVSASKAVAPSVAKRVGRSSSLNSSLALPKREASSTKAAVTAALKALQHKPPTLPLIQALMRYSTYGPNLDAFQAASKTMQKAATRDRKKLSGVPNAMEDKPIGSLKPNSDSVSLAIEDQEGSGGQSVSSEEGLLMALKTHYGVQDKASSFEDDTARRLGQQGGWAKQSGGDPDQAVRESERRKASGTSTRGRGPSLKRQTIAGQAGSSTAKEGASDPGLAFSTRQYQPVKEGGVGTAMLQQQMAQMAAAMAGMGGLQQPTGPNSSALGNGFQASSVVLWEVMSLVLMRSVLSSAVGAMSNQMTNMAQQVRGGV
jgi:hypothetical protein